MAASLGDVIMKFLTSILYFNIFMRKYSPIKERYPMAMNFFSKMHDRTCLF